MPSPQQPDFSETNESLIEQNQMAPKLEVFGRENLFCSECGTKDKSIVYITCSFSLMCVKCNNKKKIQNLNQDKSNIFVNNAKLFHVLNFIMELCYALNAIEDYSYGKKH